MSSWQNLFVPDVVLKALTELRYTEPTTIQMFALPSAIRDRLDVVGAAETGSGKTLAFGIPLIHHILRLRDEENNSEIELFALVLTPTRELAIQVKNHLKAICKYAEINVITLVGGMAQPKQERLLKKKPEIIVATPGRFWELVQDGNSYLKNVAKIPLLVIDEADRLLEKGHFVELAKLLEMINENEELSKGRQTFVFSATLTIIHDIPTRIKYKKKKKPVTQKEKLEEILKIIGVKEHPKLIDLTRKTGTAELLQEARINCENKEKDNYLYYFLVRHPGRTLVFCNSVDCVRRLNNVFTLLQRNPMCLHASMHQRQRLKNLERFSASETGLLIATDVAARGLDIPNIEHVIHYQVPRTAETYIHRSGRTARACHEGLSVMFIDPEEVSTFRKLCYTLKRDEPLGLFPVEKVLYNKLRQIVDVARNLDQKEHKWRVLNVENNWFKKMANEMDIELDEEELLLNNLGDNREQSQKKKEMKVLRNQLNQMLKKSIIPSKFSLHYPTMTGSMPSLKLEANEKAVSLMKKEKTQQKKMLKEIEKRDKQNIKKEKMNNKKKNISQRRHKKRK